MSEVTAKNAIVAALTELMGEAKSWFGSSVDKLSVRKKKATMYGYDVYINDRTALDISLFSDGVRLVIHNDIHWDKPSVERITKEQGDLIWTTLMKHLGGDEVKVNEITHSSQYSRALYRGDYTAE